VSVAGALADVTGSGLTDFLAHPFVRHALAAGTAIALASGLVGYFLVLRGQVFSGDALSHVAFTGAVAALALGVDARVGLFVATIGVGLFLGLLGPRGQPDDVVIGTVFTWVLGLGVLFLSIFTIDRSAGNSAASTTVLFGSIFGLNAAQAAFATWVGLALAAVVLALARPLLFATVDPDVARVRGVPVRWLGIAFLGLLGVGAAEATQAVGALLFLGLVAAPAGAALRLTTRPYVALFLAPGIAVACVWGGVFASYMISEVPPSFAVIALATACYLGAFVAGAVRGEPSPSSTRREQSRSTMVSSIPAARAHPRGPS
jgi:zinc/manganese transport system permease protein